VWPRLRKTVNIPEVRGNKFGIEVEMEKAVFSDYPSRWYSKRDGSLRGNNAYEFVTDILTKHQAILAIERLKNFFSSSSATCNNSDRCGTHVHINVQDLRINQLYNMLTLYYIAEEILIRRIAPEREGNLFCLRAVDAEGMIDRLVVLCNNPVYMPLSIQDWKYAAMNLTSLALFGTLEFRAISTGNDFSALKEKVVFIINFLHLVKSKAKTFSHPTDILIKFSGSDKKEFLETHYGLPWTREYEEMAERGMRMVQDFGSLIESPAHSVSPFNLKYNEYHRDVPCL